MSELIALKCRILGLSTPLCCNFISGKQPGMFSHVCLTWPRGDALYHTVWIPFFFNRPLCLSPPHPHSRPQIGHSESSHWIINPACPSPSLMLHLYNSSGTDSSALLPSLIFCWSAAQSNYLGSKAHWITTLPALITNQTPPSLTPSAHFWPLLPDGSSLPSVCCHENRIKPQRQLVSVNTSHNRTLRDKAIDS